ncbi:hypothetical protein D3C85_1032940 [compost metagenome]
MAIGDAVGESEQRLAPVDVVATDTEVHRDRAEVELGKDEGVENLAGALVVTLHLVGELVIRVRRGHPQPRQVGIDPHIVFIVEVVPAGSRHTEAVIFLVDEVELTEDVDAVGHHIALVARVGGGAETCRIPQRVVTPLHAPADVVFERVVPTHGQIGITGIDGECSRRQRRHRHDRTADDTHGVSSFELASDSFLILVHIYLRVSRGQHTIAHRLNKTIMIVCFYKRLSHFPALKSPEVDFKRPGESTRRTATVEPTLDYHPMTWTERSMSARKRKCRDGVPGSSSGECRAGRLAAIGAAVIGCCPPGWLDSDEPTEIVMDASSLFLFLSSA